MSRRANNARILMLASFLLLSQSATSLVQAQDSIVVDHLPPNITEDDLRHIAPASKSTKVIIPKPSQGAFSNKYVGSVGGTAEYLQPEDAANDGKVALLPAGLELPSVLSTLVSTETAQPGDNISATTTQSVTAGGMTIPAGTTLTGHVQDTDPTRTLLGNRPDQMHLDFDALRLPDGTVAPISCKVTIINLPQGQVQAVPSSTGFGGRNINFVKGSKITLNAGTAIMVELNHSAQIAVSASRGAL